MEMEEHSTELLYTVIWSIQDPSWLWYAMDHCRKLTVLWGGKGIALPLNSGVPIIPEWNETFHFAAAVANSDSIHDDDDDNNNSNNNNNALITDE